MIGGYAASVLHNKFNPPTVIAPDGFEVRGIKAKGTDTFVVTYAKKGRTSSNKFEIYRARKTTEVGIGPDTFRIYW